MTPAIKAAERAGIKFEILEYKHNAQVRAYGPEAARVLGLPPEAVFKTLVTKIDEQKLVVALVPVDKNLDLKVLAAASGGKRAEMVEAAEAERATGYVVGGISPLGQRRRLPMVVDESALQFAKIYVSAGRRGLEIGIRPAELISLCQATTASLARS